MSEKLRYARAIVRFALPKIQQVADKPCCVATIL
jgi:hypothetical protein